jgi:aldose 1-epimerase
MKIWGKIDGVDVPLYTLTSPKLEARVTAYGAHLVSVRTPDRNGKMADVSLGYDSLQEYIDDTKTRFGAVVGRYGNRIALGKFSIDGYSYEIPANNGRNALHGGITGFERRLWKSEEVPGGVEFTYVSPDGEMGFPGTLTSKVRYTVSGDSLRIDYFATTDKPTILNLTNHAYFNLRGDDQGTILDEVVELNADHYLPTDNESIPTGEIASVEGTPFDFRKPTPVGARINEDNQQLKFGQGYDINYVINGTPGTMRLAATVTDPDSGRKMTVETTQPGVQFYSGNHLDGTFTGRHGVKEVIHSGLCFETQHYPDAPNHPNFPSPVLRPGQQFHETTVFAFTTVK